MTPYDAFQDWLASILGEGYQYSRGMWVDHPSLDSAFIAAIQQTGGPPPDSGRHSSPAVQGDPPRPEGRPETRCRRRQLNRDPGAGSAW